MLRCSTAGRSRAVVGSVPRRVPEERVSRTGRIRSRRTGFLRPRAPGCPEPSRPASLAWPVAGYGPRRTGEGGVVRLSGCHASLAPPRMGEEALTTGPENRHKENNGRTKENVGSDHGFRMKDARGRLRARIGALEGRRELPRVSVDGGEIDRWLGGGLARGRVHAMAGPGATAFAAVLCGRLRGPVLWCVVEGGPFPPLHPPGFAALGLEAAPLGDGPCG